MACEEKGGAHVSVHHVVVFVGTRVDQVFVVADASVVDQDVDPPKRFGGSFDCLEGGALLASVPDDADRLCAELFGFVYELIKPRLASRSEDKLRALLGKDPRASLSDACACASD